jgi:rhodanese-related sulfurtransferase
VIKDKRIQFALYVVLFTVFWNIIKYVAQIVLSGGHYIDSNTNEDLMVPLTIAIVTGYLFYLRSGSDINIKVAEAREVNGAVILDVRNVEEFKQGHIPGAVNIPADNIESVTQKIPDRDTPIYSYCLSGARSSKAVRTLKTLGYTNAINIGGINRYKGELEK